MLSRSTGSSPCFFSERKAVSTPLMVAAQFSNALWMNEVFQAVYGKMVVTTSMQPVAPPTTVSLPAVSMICRRMFEPGAPRAGAVSPGQEVFVSGSTVLRLVAMVAASFPRT